MSALLFLKKWGGWLAAAVVAVAGVLFAIFRGRPPPVIAGPSPVQKKTDAEVEEHEKVLDAEAAAKSKALIAAHEADVGQLTETEKKKVEEIQTDPEAVNQFLLDVGRRQRGEG
jgi:hypothetical protein